MIKQYKFIKSAAAEKDWINDDINEVCLIGRSNVGKSTFINALTNNHKLAKVSSKPGKTRLLNFFDINNGEFRIVDAPGYGYAKVSHEQKDKFAEMMETFLTKRKNLKLVCQIVDLRHPPTKDDKMIYDFLSNLNITVLVIANKLDKVKKNDIVKNHKILKNELNLKDGDEIINVSSVKKDNIDKIYQFMVDKIKESI